MKPAISICLTVFNKESILEKVLDGIFNNALLSFELIVCFDSCSDDSEYVFRKYIAKYGEETKNFTNYAIRRGTDLYETAANNLCLKAATAEYAVIIQDDDIILERAFDAKLLRPFKFFPGEVFAVTGNCSHNWIANFDSPDYFKNKDAFGMPLVVGKYVDDRWATTLEHVDHANAQTCIDKNTFYIRDSVNRSPLCLNMGDMQKLNYFDASFVQDLDDHDLMYRMHKELNKVCGFVNIDVDRDVMRGGTRENGKTKPWLFELYHRNSIKLIRRHGDIMGRRKIENRLMK